MDQGLRPTTYPFLMPGQYVAQMSYPQQVYYSYRVHSFTVSVTKYTIVNSIEVFRALPINKLKHIKLYSMY